jgi:hypothetical protein
MTEDVYKALEERSATSGYAVVPDDIANNQVANEWWSVVVMLVR